MFKGIKNGASLIKASFQAFRKYPILIVPIVVVWLIYAPLIIYFKWYFNWDMYYPKAQYMILFLIIYFLAFILSISCSTLLELIQQKETGQDFNLGNAFLISISYNLIPILVLSFVWSIIWFFLVILKSLKGRDRSNRSNEMNAENVAKTLSGDSDGSFFSFSIDALLKAIRMIVFLIIPAFAWENMGIRESFSRGFEILRQRKAEFISGFTLSIGVEILVFLPPAIMFLISDKAAVDFPDWSWFICIFYIGLAWSYSIYLEQMFGAELYLWHMAYEREIEEWSKKRKEYAEFNKDYPKFSDVRRPSIIDNIPDLNE